MSQAPSPPRVTFAVLAYNQARFCESAVQGALEQEYPDLEVIASDDCSTDGTFERMKALVDEYSGPHRVRTCRTAANRGIAEHINAVLDAATGELVVLAAGDDVSEPDRTRCLADAWLRAGKPLVVYSAFSLIDEEGGPVKGSDVTPVAWLPGLGEADEKGIARLLLQNARWELPGLYGATACWNREVAARFGRLGSEVWYEDVAMTFRALMERRIGYVDRPLVRYRRHRASFTNLGPGMEGNAGDVAAAEHALATRWKRRLGHIEQMLVDLDTGSKLGLVNAETRDEVSAELRRIQRVTLARACWWDASLLERVRASYPTLRKWGTAEDVAWGVRRLLPMGAFVLAKQMKALLGQGSSTDRT